MFILVAIITAGIANAAYLYWQGLEKQRRDRPMFCPVGGECEKVVFSRFGTALGAKNEIWGLAYYLSLLLLLGIFMVYPPLSHEALFLIFLVSGFAVLFSTYLFFLQILVLRDYCSWCILATVINYLIFAGEALFL